MHIQSINIAQQQLIEHNGNSIPTGIYKMPGVTKVSVSKLGLEGDHISDSTVHGGEDQAVYLYSIEDTQWWSEELGRELPPGTFGENFTTAGCDLRALKLGDRLIFNDLQLEISAPRTPCFKLAHKMGDNTFVKHFASATRPGAYARVVQEGTVSLGETFSLEKTDHNYSGVVEVFDLWHAKDKPELALKKALASPLATVHRQKLEGWLAKS